MTEVLTWFGASVALAILLIMALAPLLTDLPERGRRARPVPSIPAQRGAPDLRRALVVQRQAVGPRG